MRSLLLAVVAALVLLTAFTLQQRRIGRYAEELGSVQAERDVLSGHLTTCTARHATLLAAFDTLRARSQEQQEKVTEFVSVATGERHRADSVAIVYLTQTLPASCDSAVTWAADQAPGLMEGW